MGSKCLSKTKCHQKPSINRQYKLYKTIVSKSAHNFSLPKSAGSLKFAKPYSFWDS